MLELLHDCDHLFKLFMKLLLLAYVLGLLDQIVILSFVIIDFSLMALLFRHSTIQHLIDTQFILVILNRVAPLLSYWTLRGGAIAILVDADDAVAYLLSIVIAALKFVHGVHFAQICVVFGLLTRPHFPILRALI